MLLIPHLHYLIAIAVVVAVAPSAQALEKVTSSSRATRKNLERPVNKSSTWSEVLEWEDPTKPLLDKFLKDQMAAHIDATTVSQLDYIKLGADNVTFWLKHQDSNGAIIDPYRKEEWQYSTPCFALTGIAAVKYLDRRDLLVPSIKAMDWSCLTLSEGRAANHHEDFYSPVLAHALPLFEPYVPAEQFTKWKNQLSSFDPYIIYRATPGKSNWNVVALSGEYLFYQLGIRDNLDFVEDSLAGQGGTWGSKYGLYLEGPMAYDHFPRLWAADMAAAGYDGKFSSQLNEMLRRASITSLFMQSPWGELPLGHRSAHHQWNEAEQCVTYEIYADKAIRDGKRELAGAFKRAAHLAFSSMKRWQRSSGELYINKNKVEPGEAHGYEGYSGHSQYNLLPMAMLVIAYQHSLKTADVKELPAPADVGGFVLHVPELHKVFANAGGAYLEIETCADLHYDVTGLARVHFKGTDPQLGPSDLLTSKSSYRLPKVDRIAAACGPVWKTAGGKKIALADFGQGAGVGFEISNVSATPSHVTFQASYTGNLHGPDAIMQHFDVRPDAVTMGTFLQNYNGAASLEWPVFSDNGKEKTTVVVKDKTVINSLGPSSQSFAAPGATRVSVSDKQFPNRNGWARLAHADFDAGTTMTLIFAPVAQR